MENIKEVFRVCMISTIINHYYCGSTECSFDNVYVEIFKHLGKGKNYIYVIGVKQDNNENCYVVTIPASFSIKMVNELLDAESNIVEIE